MLLNAEIKNKAMDYFFFFFGVKNDIDILLFELNSRLQSFFYIFFKCTNYSDVRTLLGVNVVYFFNTITKSLKLISFFFCIVKK